MQIGITLPHYDYSFDSKGPISFNEVLTAAKIIESSGFDSLYISDHLALDIGKYGGRRDEKSGAFPKFQSLEPLTTMAAIAASTSTIKLGTLVLCEALRHPVVTAASAKTLNDISGGRFSLGLGAGWYEPDYEVVGQSMPQIGDRMTRLTESAQIIRQLFDGKSLDFEGKFYSAKDASLESTFETKNMEFVNIPFFLGGKGDRLLRIIARYCDGWNTCWAYEFDDYRDRVESLNRACEKYDRDPKSIHRSLGLYCVVADTQNELEEYFNKMCELSPPGVADGKTLESWKSSRLVGTTEEVAEQISKWAGLGVNEIIVNPGFAPFHVGSNEVLTHLGDCLGRALKIAGLN